MSSAATPSEQRPILRPAAARLASEFGGIFDSGTIELFLNASYDRLVDRPGPQDALVVMAERFAHQRLTALARVEGKGTEGLPGVLFLCVHNAGRSQMALGWFNHLAGSRALAWSGGSEPAEEINPAAVAAMAEVGIDISREFPKPWTDEIVRTGPHERNRCRPRTDALRRRVFPLNPGRPPPARGMADPGP